MHIPTQEVRTDAFTMPYFRFGQGKKTFVILPGLSLQPVTAAADAVASAYKAFEKDYTVYVFDRRSDLPPVYSISDMAADTAKAFEALGLEQVYLFGASQGGMIAMTLALEKPALVRRLALGSTAARVTPTMQKTLDAWLRLAEQKDGVGLYLAFGEKIYPPALFNALRSMLAEAGKTVPDADFARFAVLAGSIQTFDLSDRLSSLRCPVLALGASDDAVLGENAAEELFEKLGDRPDVQTYLYTDRGHAAYDTAPDYKDRLLRFFA